MTEAMFRGYPRYTKFRDGPDFYWRDNRERILFDQSNYIPGNGAHHRLGKKGTADVR
jgi:hypothetical protein